MSSGIFEPDGQDAVFLDFLEFPVVTMEYDLPGKVPLHPGQEIVGLPPVVGDGQVQGLVEPRYIPASFSCARCARFTSCPIWSRMHSTSAMAAHRGTHLSHLPDSTVVLTW